jgi:hypothetical protein
MEINPIYKFMKENRLTQKDEATFISEYSNPQKSAELHKFMTDNGLTTKGADDFYNQYFSASKKKEPTTKDSGQPAKPSTPSFGQKVVSETLTQEVQIPLRGQQKAPVQKKPYQDITYKREQLPSETTQMPETPVIKAAKQDFKQTQIKPQVQLKSTPEELEAIEKKTEKADRIGLVLNEYQSNADMFNDLDRLKNDDVNAFYRGIKDARPDLYEKYSGRTIDEGRSIESDIKESQKDRDIVYKNFLSDLQTKKNNNDRSVQKAGETTYDLISSKVTKDNYGNYTDSKDDIFDSPIVDMDKVDAEAVAIAEKYNLPTDGESWRLLKNQIKSKVGFLIDQPKAESIFNEKYADLSKKRQELFDAGFKDDDAILANAESQLNALEDQYKLDAKNELISTESQYKTKSDQLNQQYKQFNDQAEAQQAEINRRYQSKEIDKITYEDQFNKIEQGKQDYYQQYKSNFPSPEQYLKTSNEINSKYNRKFELQRQAIASRVDAELKSAYDKYSKTYKENPELLLEINEAYKDSYKLAGDIRLLKIGKAANPMSKLYESTFSSMGGVFKGWGGSIDSKTLELFGESMEQNFTMPAARTEEFKDWVDSENIPLLVGQLAGSMIPSMAITATVATATGGQGIPAIVPMIAGGLAGWGTETIDIVGRSYLDMFEKSGGDVVRANKAAESSLKSQYDIMFTYAFDALPFVGKVLKGVPTKFGRVAAGAGIELGTEFLQEYPQNIAEENIQKGLDPWTNLGEALQDGKKMKQTLISIGPVAIMGGGGQLRSKSAKQESIDTYAAMQQKNALQSSLPDQKRQYIQNMVFDQGGKFARGVIGALYANGTIDEEGSQDLLVELERSEKIKEAGTSAGLKGSKLNVYGFYSARAEEAERNAAKFGNDPILLESYKQQAKQYRDAGIDFMKGNNPDLLTVTYADGSQAFMAPEDVNGLFSNPVALTLLSKNKISVEAYREGGLGGKALQELQERSEAYKKDKKYISPTKRGTPLEYWQGLAERRIKDLETQQPELSEEEKLTAIKKIEDEVNASFEAQSVQENQQKKDARDIEIEQVQQQREALGVSEVDAFFSDMKPLVATMVERMEAGQNAPQSGVKAASEYLYAKYKELTAMKSDPNRMMTIAQIESIQAQIEQDLETLAGNPPSQKTETNDQENIQGIPSEVGVGQESVTAQPIEVTSEEAAPTGGAVQAQEEVTPTTEAVPQATEEVTAKPSRKDRLAKLFETSDGEEAVPLIEQALSEGGIKVEVKDDADYNEDERIKASQGRGSEGMFIADDGTIVLNRDKIKGEWGKTIVFHEGIHPVINIIRNTDPKRYKAIVDGLKAEAAKNKDVAKAAADIAGSKEYQERGAETIEDETVVETMARVSTGDIDIDTFEPTFREKFIEFMNDIAKALGLRPILTNSPRVEVKRLADQINKMLNEGGKLSDVVGKKNVGKFQNTLKTGPQERAVSIAKGKESLIKYGLKKGANTTRKIGEALEKRSRELYGIISREDRSEKALKAISSFMADEVRFFVEEFGENSGKGWYGEKFQKGLDAMAAVFPEMKDDQNARDLFTMLVAITSDGTEVMQNFQQASLAYKNYKETGKMPTVAKAQRAESYLVNFNNIQTLLDKYDGDIQAIKKELLTIGSISELNKQRKTQGLEKLDTKWPASFKVPLASSIFGPKLGMFYANLSGMEQYPTLDRWWSRTFNRYRGTLIPQITKGYNKKGEALGIDRYREIAGLKDASEEEVLAKIVQDHDTYEDKGYKKGTPAEKAANTLYKKLYVELNDAPFGAKDRQFMYDAFIETQKKLKRSGIDVTIADVQAILWYFEKNLYKKLGVTKPIQGISYEDAAKKTYEKWKNSGNSFNYAIKDSEQGETIDEVDIDEESAPKGQPSKGINRGDNLVKETYYESGLTEDKNDYVFFHVSSAPEASIRKGIDSTKYTSLRTSREEKGLQYGVASYYTRPEDGERMVGGEKYAVRVPKSKVYPIDSDPLGYGEKAEAKIPQGTPFRGEAVKREIADMAKKNGYEMIVGEWAYSRSGKPAGEVPEFRADAIVPLRPTKEKPESFTSNAEKGMDRVAFPGQQSEEAKQGLEDLASEVRDAMSSKKKFSSKEYELADSVYMNGQVTENKNEDNELKRDITAQEYDMMTKVLPKSMQAEAARVRGLLFGKKGQASISIPRTSKEFSDNASETVDRIKTATSEDGATLNVDGTTYENGGLVVPAGSSNVAQEDVSPEGLYDFLKDNEENISSDIFKIGLYKFPDRPEVSYDLNIVTPREHRDVALEFARLAGQESLFDLDTFENIKTGADGKNPRKFTAQELAEIAKDLSEGKLPKIVSEEKIVDSRTKELQEEAKKYRTANAFIKAQGKPVYHGSKAAKIIEKEGFKLLPYELRNMASAFGEGVYFATKKSGAYTSTEDGMVEAYLPPNIKLKQVYDQDAYRVNEKKLIEEGYAGVELQTGGPSKNLTIFDPSIVKTKTQLIDIWNSVSEKTKQGQPSMVNRTSAEVRQLMEDSMDAVDQDIANGVDAKTAVENNVTSQDWYGELTPKQKQNFDEIITDEFGVTPEAPVKKPTGIKATIANIIDNYYKGDRQSKLDNKQILESDPKLKYIYDNIAKINKQLQDAGVITDKTDGCP